MAVRYNPNPGARITTEPLYQVERTGKISSVYGAQRRQRTDSLSSPIASTYVIPVVDDDSPLDFQVNVSEDFQKAVFRPAKTNVQAQVSGRELSIPAEKARENYLGAG